MRKLLYPLCLSAAGLAGSVHAGLIGIPPLAAQEQPLCPNSMCSGPSYCVYGKSHSCHFPGPNSCATQRCAFVLEH